MLITSGLTMPTPIVAATAVPAKDPITLKKVAKMMALLGERTLVLTTVAIALGASVQPLTNSAQSIKNNAKSKMGEIVNILKVFDNYLVNGVCGIFQFIDNVFDPSKNIFKF